MEEEKKGMVMPLERELTVTKTKHDWLKSWEFIQAPQNFIIITAF